MASWKRCTYVDGSALTVQSPDHVGRADSLTLAQLDDGADVAEKGLQEQLQVEACLLVDVGRNALDAATAS
jgi:hypothetical protein